MIRFKSKARSRVIPNGPKKTSLLHNERVFYGLVILTCAFGAYTANVIEDNFRIIANGVVGLVTLYLIYLAFVSPKNVLNKRVELDDLEIPKDIRYFFFAFFWTMIMFWAGGLIFGSVLNIWVDW